MGDWSENNFASITTSYATGLLTGGTEVGGLVGEHDGPGTITNSYWNITTTGTATGLGGGVGGVGTPTGLTTAQLSSGLPSGFSPSVWANVGNQTAPYLITNPGPIYVGSDSFPSNPIFTPQQLQDVTNSPTASFVLTQDIDMSGFSGFTPIGETTPYTGTFNGMGFVIANLSVTGTGSTTGLFGQIGAGGVVKNTGLLGGSITTIGGEQRGRPGRHQQRNHRQFLCYRRSHRRQRRQRRRAGGG